MNDSMELIAKIQDKLKDKLSEKRFQHTLGVQYTCACMAMRYGEDVYLASLAGLLHDCVKYMSDEKLLEKCMKYQIPVRDVEQRNPYLLHAKLGAYYAKEKYGVSDSRVLSAITWHTTGKPDMNLLEKILFAADYLEPGRKQIPGLTDVRRLAFVDIDQTVALILKNTLSYLDGMNSKEIDSYTREAYEYYSNL
ncbi:MAG: bis(5'-nucleosyl)-tetraphosphatase (symmetrical) YqeK [Clostridiales bacterium]|nr:bis(5'-nucleosyl)-tetraphosphatase (symmetrical) YqeK [Clostridiales bacterium]